MKCEHQIRMKLNFTKYRHCKNEVTVIVNGHHYCSIHNPENIEKRQEKNREKKVEKCNLKKAMYYTKLLKSKS